jgi:glycosyltransferase involved in cell wall biosynthesis
LKLDIVIPIYNEQENLEELFKRLSKVGETLEDVSWRVIYVNDGSRDCSLPIMLQQAARDPRFHILDLSRNFGHQAAITAGLGQASGDAVVIMDGDLQDPPELIPELLRKWQEGAQVVRAERRSRQERGMRRVGFDLFHAVFKWISDFPIPAQSGIFGLLDGRVVKELNKFREKNRFFPGLRSWVGFSQAEVYYDRRERAAGEPKQSMKRLIRYALDAVFSFSYKPLRIMTGLGLVICICGFVLAMFFAVRRIIGVEVAATGFTTLVTLILFLGGVQLVAVGLLGEYLARIYDEVKQRPLYIVKKTHGLSEQAAATGETIQSLSLSNEERLGEAE